MISLKNNMKNSPAYNNKSVFVVDGARTPFLKARRKEGAFSASDLAVNAGRPLLKRQSFKPSDIDEVVVGCVIPAPEEANIARVISLRLGCGKLVPAWTVQRNCASGMQALDCAATSISSGRSDIVLVGGVEAMSRSPVMLNRKMVGWLSDWLSSRDGISKFKTLLKLRGNHFTPVFSLLLGLTDHIVNLSMGHTAEILAHRFKISRREMDTYASESHKRLANAQDKGVLGEIEVIYDSKGNYYEIDDGVRRDSTAEGLGKLRPAFDKKDGLVTAGNSAQITDGAALLILASEDAIKKYDLTVMGRIVDCNWAGVEPAQMGLGPAHAVPPLLKRNNLNREKIDFWEINEAFSTQVLACRAAWKDEDYCKKELGLESAFGEIDDNILNIDGGAISLGHPIGASGARIVLHLLNVLEQKKANLGVATLCIGGGQGGAMLIEREK